MRVTRQLGLPPKYPSRHFKLNLATLEYSRCHAGRATASEPQTTRKTTTTCRRQPSSKGGPRETTSSQLRKNRIPFHRAFATVPCQIDLAEAVKGTR